MPHLLESIKLENGQWHRLPYHEQRLQQAQLKLFGKVTIRDLAHQISIPDDAQQGVHKCRVVYGEVIERVEFVPYQRRPVGTLRRVHCDTIDYSHKYADRSLLNELYAQRDGCDDVLIIKNGLVTDTSYANLVFYDGQRWVTPAHPLLRGTQRQYLLETGLIHEEEIRENHLFELSPVSSYQCFSRFSCCFLPRF